MISKEYGWVDRTILELPYYRFCQILETINRRLVEEQKFGIEVKEIIARFMASVFTAGSYLTKEGKQEILDGISDFTMLKKGVKEIKEAKKENKNLPPKGSYEKLMQLFGGGGK